ncbi:MAG: ABC transporter ATP-binding protein [Acidothermus cellulolyticus]|nr:ABC transporter ATP-binding protein [Acidothermus cellulolyticus]
MTQTATSDRPPAVIVDHVTKDFKLYRERRTSLKERLTTRRPSRYELYRALDDVSLVVPAGSTYGLIGANGSGKSTLLKLMANIHRPTSGTITHNGRITALLELGAGFHPELSGRDNVYLNGSILGLSRKQVAAAMDDIIEFSGLRDFIDAPVKVYSSGMYVRLGFSVAVNLDPEILIIDEVIAVGDEEFQRRCFDHLAKLRRRGVTIIFVSHSMPLVQTLCDRVAWIDRGVLRAEGDPSEVVDAYLAVVNAAERERLAAQGEAAASGEAVRRGSREIVVTNVSFLDGNGEPTLAAVAGERLVVRVHYAAAQPVTAPVFGLAFHTEGGVLVSSPNTEYAGVRFGTLHGEGYVEYVLDHLPLTPGTYLVSASITDTSLLHVYDQRDRAFTLTVQPGHSLDRGGVVTLGGRWSVVGSTVGERVEAMS